MTIKKVLAEFCATSGEINIDKSKVCVVQNTPAKFKR